MCGILGYIDRKKAIDPELFKDMRDTLHHRGPDGAHSVFLQEGKVALGHRRLSIIDLSEDGRQPMSNEDGTVWLTFNGEIYNFKELRKELIQLGHTFSSQTDSEVLLHGYESWGIDLLDRVEGMFAFAIWDEVRKELWVVRDRVGVKPLYWFVSDTTFQFGSELKAIVSNPEVPRAVDWESVADFLMYRFIPQPRTIWKGIQKLAPGYWLKYRFEDGSVQQERYWSLAPDTKVPDDREAIEKAEYLLKNSIQSQLVSDVPLGVFLSGGYDSTAITMHMKQAGHAIDSFSIGFSNWGKSEHVHAKVVADTFRTQHHEWVLDDEMSNLPEKLAYFYDEPLGGSSFLPTYLVSAKASEHVKVILSGDGGDEVFAGYGWHNRLYETLHPKQRWQDRLFGKAKVVVPKVDLAGAYHNFTSWTQWSYADLPEFIDPELVKDFRGKEDAWVYRQYLQKGVSPIKAFQLLDYHTLMPEVFLTKVDRAAMANSLEVRVPFLNKGLMEYTMSLDEKVYYQMGYTKYLLYHQLKRHVPKSILNKPKKGFSAPKKRFLTPDSIRSTLHGGELLKAGVLQPKPLERMLEENNQSQLWALCVLEHWFHQWQPTN